MDAPPCTPRWQLFLWRNSTECTLDISQYLLIILVSVLGSAATAGTTGAIVMLTLTLSTVGLPLDGVGLLLAIDPDY